MRALGRRESRCWKRWLVGGAQEATMCKSLGKVFNLVPASVA
jgi:hypothetical protein